MSGEKLKQDLEQIKKNVDLAIAGITSHEYAYVTNPGAQRQLKTCINIFDNQLDVVTKKLTPGRNVKYCEHFNGSVCACKDLACDYHKANLEYVNSQSELNAAYDNLSAVSSGLFDESLKHQGR